MVRVLIYHGGYPEYLRMCYVGGEIYDQGEIDVDVLSITDWTSKLKELGYKNYSSYWYKLDDEVSDKGLSHICNDSDVITLIGRILTDNRKVLHLYVDHETDEADLIDPTEQPIDASEFCLLDGGGVQDGVVEGVGEENLSDYDTTDAEYEDLSTTDVRGKNNETMIEWFGAGAYSNVHDVDVVSSDSADSERDIESLSSESDNVEATRSRRNKKIKYPEFTEHDLKGKIKLKKGLRFPNTSMFKAAIKTYSIQNGFDYVYKHNDKIRVTAECKLKCGWRIHASQSNARDAIQIKTFISTHNCGTQHENKKANVIWIANQYLEDFRDDPTWTEYALRERIKRDYNIRVPRWAAYRAKKVAMKKVYGMRLSTTKTFGTMLQQCINGIRAASAA
jgi:hypothetical protein